MMNEFMARSYVMVKRRLPARTKGAIIAEPNPIRLPCQFSLGIGATTLQWTSTGTDAVEVHVGTPDGPLLSRGGPSGNAVTAKWVSDGMLFYLQNVSGQLPLTLANTLDVIQVKVGTVLDFTPASSMSSSADGSEMKKDAYGESQSNCQKEIVQGLWIGDSLSTMEELSMRSFLVHGHEYHLYAYEDIRNVPAGVILRDANEIIPSSRIFRHRENRSLGGFSDLFRYKLLLEKGGYWADTDVICLKPFVSSFDHVFAVENTQYGAVWINGAVMKAPAGSGIMEYCYDISSAKKAEKICYDEIGPALLSDAVPRFGLTHCVQPTKRFYPVNWWEWRAFTSGNLMTCAKMALRIDKEVCAVHLYNEMWPQEDKNRKYHQRSLYERLKKQFLGKKAE